ncbi:hypothetical protein PL371_12595 [Tenacibaculum maritimum]|nr:hypothetical protein [Tenacibaculum maritimum]MDB0612694.1 hypothetical protein [Tenacibaculum maritimum]
MKKQIEVEVIVRHILEIDTTDPQYSLYKSDKELVNACAKRNFEKKSFFPALTTETVKSVEQKYLSHRIIN